MVNRVQDTDAFGDRHAGHGHKKRNLWPETL